MVLLAGKMKVFFSVTLKLVSVEAPWSTSELEAILWWQYESPFEHVIIIRCRKQVTHYIENQ